MTDPITRPSLKVSRLPAPLPSLLTPEQIEAVFARLQAERPNPRTELTYSSPFELLIAVILSAQATDISVNLATATLYPLANTPQAILALGRDELVKHIRRIGLYNAKADNILKTCHALLDRLETPGLYHKPNTGPRAMVTKSSNPAAAQRGALH